MVFSKLKIQTLVCLNDLSPSFLPLLRMNLIKTNHLPVREALGRPVWGRRSCLGCRSHGGRGQGATYPKVDQRRRTLGRWRPTLHEGKKTKQVDMLQL